MAIIDKIKLARVLQMYAKIATDGGDIEVMGDLVVGADVFVSGEDGEPIPAPDGNYTTEDGKVIVVSGGIISEIKEAEAPSEEQEEALAEDEQEQATEDAPEALAEQEQTPDEVAEDVARDIAENEILTALEARVTALENALKELLSALAMSSDKPAEKVVKVDDTPQEFTGASRYFASARK